MRLATLVLFFAPLLVGCTSTSKQPSRPSAFVQGKATVLQVDNTLGMALLKVDGKQVPAYWESDVVVPFRVEGVDTHRAASAPANSLAPSKKEVQPVTQHVDLPAKPGDTIVFRGMKTGDELLLRYVQVVPN
ncbi:MAG TPA: hypothetical protein VM008_03610 [Phycisphaerae bacterium]|nr:hypothetical protein [Phycisphaerae bacterium]